MRRSAKPLLVVLVILVVFGVAGAAGLVGYWRHGDAFFPTALSEVEARTGIYLKPGEIERGGKQYYVVTFPMHMSPVRFPSGPPEAVYDSEGRLVDKTTDVGDDERFRNAWDRREEE